jgi:hypothetical protein
LTEILHRSEADGRSLFVRPSPSSPAAAVLEELLLVMDAAGEASRIPIDAVFEDEGRLTATGAGPRAEVTLSLAPSDGLVVLDLEVHWTGAPDEAGLRLVVHPVGAVEAPRWLVPGCFYRENRPEGSRVPYPRAVLGSGDERRFESSWWSFRSDRAAAPAVFGWTAVSCVGIAADPETDLGMTGVGFGEHGGAARVWVDLPFREGPVVYRGDDVPGPPVVTTHRWERGEVHRIRLLLDVSEPFPHAYVPLLRARYELDRCAHPLGPWMAPEQAAALTAHGLFAWHWRPEHEALFETAAFDRAHPELDRPAMHVAWVSGVPWAGALLAYGRRVGDHRYVDAGLRVIDLICSARTPARTFWGEWTRDRGWRCGWNADPDLLHARTLAEATLFTIRALRRERTEGVDHDAWARAAADNLAHAAASQDGSGDLGAYYHQGTGEVVDRSGAAGLLWVAALVEGAVVLDQPYLVGVAQRAGRHYASFVEDAFINGAPEDVHLAPTSEDAYNAVIAYVRLHEIDPDPQWLHLARLAAEWTMTFRWTYDIRFGDHTILSQYRFRTRGADNASPPNQHLGSYGLIALEELLLLWRWTGDRYYLERGRDNLACFLQFIARADGDFNAGKGMVTERYYHTDCFQPKGSILTLSHAWCVGVTLLGAQVAMDDPGAFPPDLGWATEGGPVAPITRAATDREAAS